MSDIVNPSDYKVKGLNGFIITDANGQAYEVVTVATAEKYADDRIEQLEDIHCSTCKRIFPHTTIGDVCCIPLCAGLLIRQPRINLGDEVTHPEIYSGNEVFTVVGIRILELELRGDWSGGTHNVDQVGWHKREGTIKKI